MSIHLTRLSEVLRRDPRYALEAYEFVFQALGHTQRLLGRVPDDLGGGDPGREYHVSGPELLAGIRDLALREFGLMARTVFRMWGINRTDDFGNIVFNLIEENLMSRTDEDCRDDFRDVFDLDKELMAEYRIELDDPT